MIKVLVKTNVLRQEVVTETTTTPGKVFEDLGISLLGSMVNLNGTTLYGVDLNSSFESLGVTDGSTVSLNSIIKADGAVA